MKDNDDIFSEMGVEQKARLVAGRSYWRTHSASKIAAITFSDGPHGLRRQDAENENDNLGLGDSYPAVCYPAACTTACSFDPTLLELMGRALGEECRKNKVDVLLGPGANIKRHPLCGRNFEYFSEDPLLAGKVASGYISGLQSQGVGASLKHFAFNNQEHHRMVSDSVVDERAANELYLRPFEIAVKETQPWTVMASYNKVNGTYAAQNQWLLEERLRNSWGFTGAVISDWGAVNDPASSVQAGLDLCMPGPDEGYSHAVAHSVNAGKTPQEALDRAVKNIAALSESAQDAIAVTYTSEIAEHLAVARLCAQESAVLLKNDGALPLSPIDSIAVIGAFAKQPRYQGAGSSLINPIALDCPWDALENAQANVSYASGYDPKTGETNAALLDLAEQLAQNSAAAVVFVGLPDSYESEGYDRRDMKLPQGMLDLVERVCKANSQTAVVLQCGSPVELPFKDDCAAILLSYLGGCQNGAATADILLGEVNPSGKLAESWPEHLEDTALGKDFPDSNFEILYKESLYVGYRYYDSADITPAFPFGHGLSYTSFEYDNLQVEFGRSCLEVSLDVTNTGHRDGAEAVQLYVHANDPAVFMPEQQLVAFKKLRIPACATMHASFKLDARAFAYWDAERQDWRVDEGSYELRAAASSRDVRQRASIQLQAESAPFTVERKRHVDVIELQQLDSYYNVVAHGFSNEEFALLYDGELPKPAPKRPFTSNSTLEDITSTPAGRILFKAGCNIAAKVLGLGKEAMSELVESIGKEMPLRMLSMLGITRSTIDDIVEMLNGHLGKSTSNLLRNAFKHK